MNWDYLQPVKIHFGKGRVKEIKEIARELGCERGLLVAGPFFFKSGLAEKVIKESEGMIVASFGDVSPNPDVVEVDACAEVIRQKNIGFVVALGGGSPMDCAKAAASVALTSDSIRKYHGTGVAMPEKHLPLIAVPTTAGTGSEVTCVSVLSDHANGKKAPIVSEGFYPAAAIIDPELTYTMPHPRLRQEQELMFFPMRSKAIGAKVISRSVMYLRCMQQNWYLNMFTEHTGSPMMRKQGRKCAKHL